MPRKRNSDETLVKKVSVRKKRVTKPVAEPLVSAVHAEPEPLRQENEAPATPPTTPSHMSGKKVVYVTAVVVLSVLALLWYTLVYTSDSAQQARSLKEAEQLINEVGSLLLLPRDETPVVYIINDPELLKRQQPFFIDAEEGDVLLVYQRAVKAIIYSPERNIIVNVGGIATEDGFNLPDSQNVSSETTVSATTTAVETAAE